MRWLRTLRRVFRRVFVRCDDYRPRFEWVRPKLGFGLYHFGDDGAPGRWSIMLFFVWIRLWRTNRPLADEDGMFDSWSIDFRPFTERNIYLHWGAWHKFINFPWALDWIETAHMDTQGVFVRESWNDRGRHASQVLNDPLEEQQYPFTYVTNRGEIQRTTVTVRTVERMRWQWTLFRRLRLPFMKRTRYSLNLWFADEMGSERGSWKGGVIGTGCAFVPGETVQAAVRRFENRANMEKKFCR